MRHALGVFNLHKADTLCFVIMLLQFVLLQIIRGIAMGLALIMYGREEEAETLIEQMSRDQDPILR